MSVVAIRDASMDELAGNLGQGSAPGPDTLQ
jgi:hypothetical protein